MEKATKQFCDYILPVQTKPITVKSKPTNSKNMMIVKDPFNFHIFLIDELCLSFRI